jgi:hypothetical protein
MVDGILAVDEHGDGDEGDDAETMAGELAKRRKSR